MDVSKSEFAHWLAAVGSGPTAKVNKAKKTDRKGSLIQGTPFAVADTIALLRSAAHATKNRHPRSSGRMFSDIAQSSGNGDPVREGRGADPRQVGVNNEWWYPGGAPPGYPVPGPNDSMVVMESGTIFGTGGRQPWADPGYPNKQDLEIDLPDESEDDEDTETP